MHQFLTQIAQTSCVLSNNGLVSIYVRMYCILGNFQGTYKIFEDDSLSQINFREWLIDKNRTQGFFA